MFHKTTGNISCGFMWYFLQAKLLCLQCKLGMFTDSNKDQSGWSIMLLVWDFMAYNSHLCPWDLPSDSGGY